MSPSTAPSVAKWQPCSLGVAGMLRNVKSPRGFVLLEGEKAHFPSGPACHYDGASHDKFPLHPVTGVRWVRTTTELGLSEISSKEFQKKTITQEDIRNGFHFRKIRQLGACHVPLSVSREVNWNRLLASVPLTYQKKGDF
ncbi:hypothetical protein CDAR_117011 [Caerostris darwini]|uniref:Uncharacterized protein n=1 Tax=Caerostris darwini TaxID=1538125 RepID=A0AAV4W7K7_9ARAC|nr:hypothetical protein CDAR_117011 [Caerostris darwini]